MFRVRIAAAYLVSDSFDCTHQVTSGVASFPEAELPRAVSSYLELNGDLSEIRWEARDLLSVLLRGWRNDHTYACPPSVLLAQVLEVDGILVEVFRMLKQWDAGNGNPVSPEMVTVDPLARS